MKLLFLLPLLLGLMSPAIAHNDANSAYYDEGDSGKSDSEKSGSEEKGIDKDEDDDDADKDY